MWEEYKSWWWRWGWGWWVSHVQIHASSGMGHDEVFIGGGETGREEQYLTLGHCYRHCAFHRDMAHTSALNPITKRISIVAQMGGDDTTS